MAKISDIVEQVVKEKHYWFGPLEASLNKEDLKKVVTAVKQEGHRAGVEIKNWVILTDPDNDHALITTGPSWSIKKKEGHPNLTMWMAFFLKGYSYRGERTGK